MNATPRLRMFAGPNGSGKSTIKAVIAPQLLGVYLNPDELERTIKQTGILDLSIYGIQASEADVVSFFSQSVLMQKAGLSNDVAQLRYTDGQLDFSLVTVNSYWAAVITDFLRQKMLETNRSFTFETVMSSADKVTLLERAQRQGYRTYLYYIATDDPLINISRVKHRVKMGGHSVPEDKIISRYERSLSLLIEAIRHTNRAYIFDNSLYRQVWLAEITDGKILELKLNQVPAWFKRFVLDKL